MKKLFFTIATLFVSSLVMGQTTTENYVKSTAYQIETQDGTNSLSGNPLVDDDKIENITYYDGLGRPKQRVTYKSWGVNLNFGIKS